MNLDYFKDKNLQVLFEALKLKYIKKSGLIGTIKIIPNNDEANKISRFLGKNIKAKEVNIIKIKDIELALNLSIYDKLSIEDILFGLYGNIKTKDDIKFEEEFYINNLVHELLDYYQDRKIDNWLSDNLKDKQFYLKTVGLLKTNKKLIYNIIDALNELLSSTESINLSIFASNITNDPHYFDLDTFNGNNFLWYLVKYLKEEYPSSRRDMIYILKQVGLYIDNYSNYVITYNLMGEDYLDILKKRKEVVLLNLENVNLLNEIYTLNKKVIILENPSLLPLIKDLDIDMGIIITSGNPNLVVYEILHKIKEHKLYYHGDYDPEGLLIADKLKNIYPNIELILYNKESYDKAISNKSISRGRLKKLENIKCQDLIEIKDLILKYKFSGYQEKICEELLKFIKNENNIKE